MNSNKVHSRRTVPTFSWEEKPGVRKVVSTETPKTNEEYNYFISGTNNYQQYRRVAGGTGDDNKSQAFKVINKLPPPPGPPENKYRSANSLQNYLQIPPPPCTFSQPPPLRCSSKKKIDDPFLIAYKECTKSSRKDHKLGNYEVTTTANDGGNHGGLMEFGFGLGLGLKKKNISFFSCKQSCSSVVADSITKATSQFPVLRSRKETCRHQNA